MLRAVAVTRMSEVATSKEPALGRAVLQHDERNLRRRAIRLVDGRKILVDLPETVVLAAGDALVIEGGGIVEIAAAGELLYEIRGRDPVHVTELAWHIGNRHLAAAIEASRILILRDHVIKTMLEGLGAHVEEILAEFNPVRGAYSGNGEHASGHDPIDALSHDADHRHNHSHVGLGHHHDDGHAHLDHHSHSHAHVHGTREHRHD
jgi:urease accessory protein